MSKRTRTVVYSPCIADRYHGPNERIIEFAGPGEEHGGLISFRLAPDGRLAVEVYRMDERTFCRNEQAKP